MRRIAILTMILASMSTVNAIEFGSARKIQLPTPVPTLMEPTAARTINCTTNQYDVIIKFTSGISGSALVGASYTYDGEPSGPFNVTADPRYKPTTYIGYSRFLFPDNESGVLLPSELGSIPPNTKFKGVFLSKNPDQNMDYLQLICVVR